MDILETAQQRVPKVTDWTISPTGTGCESCLSQQGEGSGGSHRCIQLPEGRLQRGRSQGFFSSAQWQDYRKWEQTETQEFPSEHHKTLSFFYWLSAGTGCPESLCSLHPWRYSKAGGLDQMSSRSLFQPQPCCNSAVLWFKGALLKVHADYFAL